MTATRVEPAVAAPSAGRAARRLAMVAADSPRAADGIRDYTHRLLQQFQEDGTWDSKLHLRDPGGRGWIDTDLDELAHADVVIVQYNPFWYGRRGFAPGLPLDLWRLRRRSGRPVIALMVHETFVDMRGWRWILMGAWQRLQMLLVQTACDVQFFSIDTWADQVGSRWRAAPSHHLPVASNFPDMRACRDQVRAELGADTETTVLACFGLGHPGRMEDHIAAACQAVTSTGRKVLLLSLGAAAAPLSEAVPGVEVVAPGFVAEPDVARLVAAADILLAPYEDGVSTRRGTVMSALQHEVAVLGTCGKFTDRILRESTQALALVEVGAVADYAATARSLVDSPDSRRRIAHAGRQLYERNFDWPVIAQRLVTHLGEAGAAA